MRVKAATFFGLLLEAKKQENYRRKWALTVAAYPYVSQDAREDLRNMLTLPDDVLHDILAEESSDQEKQAFKRELNGN